MRTLTFLFALLFALSGCQPADKSVAAEMSIATSSINKVELIDFYGTHRCVTCEAIEENAKYTVEHFFKDAVKEGKLSFVTINVDEEANYDMAEKFEATGTALFINVVKDGTEQHIDLTTFAFEKGTDKEVFSEELKAKLEQQLKSL